MDDFIGRLAASAGVHGRAAVAGRRISPFVNALGKTQVVRASTRSPVAGSCFDYGWPASEENR
jgi:hypothetical protein